MCELKYIEEHLDEFEDVIVERVVKQTLKDCDDIMENNPFACEKEEEAIKKKALGLLDLINERKLW